jgi:NAD(P)H-dependent FMN reductase
MARGADAGPGSTDPASAAMSEAGRPALAIVVASTRPGRVGLPVARWFEQRARSDGRFDVTLLDLAEVGLPFLDEPHHPRLRQYTKPHTLAWSATVEAQDAFVFVLPEYNYGFNAVIKNALDFLHVEWKHKPVAFVSYGGVAAGTRAVQLIKPVVAALQMVAVHDAVHIPFVAQHVTEDGIFVPPDGLDSAADAVLEEVAAMEEALRPRRAALRA